MFPPPEMNGSWTCADVSKRVTRSLFLDLGLVLLSGAESSLLQQLVGTRYRDIDHLSQRACRSEQLCKQYSYLESQ